VQLRVLNTRAIVTIEGSCDMDDHACTGRIAEDYRKSNKP